MLLLLISFAIFTHHSLADDGLDNDFEKFLTVGKHSSCNIEQRFPPLHRAAMTGNIRMATKVLMELKKSGGNCINFQDSEGMTALHWASLGGHGEIVRSLLESGANSSLISKCKNTALHLAAHAGCVKSVGWLVIFCGDLNARNENGSTALHLAVEKENFSIVELLIRSCAKLNITDFKGRTPLDLAEHNQNWAIMALLKASGANSAPQSEQYRWINQTREDFKLPSCALKGGTTYGGQRLYVGRIWNQNGYIPATIIPYHKKIITVISGKYNEMKVNFQVLCGKHLAWKPKKSNDEIPETAVVISTSSKGEKLYMGRTFVSYSGKEIMTLGKVSGADGVLSMPFYSNDSMVTAKDYEMLIFSH